MQERRLAAIMLVLRSENVGGPTRRSLCEGGPGLKKYSEGGCTDILEYAALTDGDADRAIEMLCRHREILRPAIDKHKGENPEESGYKLPANFHTTLTF